MNQVSLRVNAVIFGGGIAGLWILDALRCAGYSAILLEDQALGGGQTIWSQGIIHGGAKYTLRGLSDSLANVTKIIADMPAVWSDCFAGRRQPDFRNVPIRAPHCHLWRTSGFDSWAGIMAASHVLKTPVRKLESGEIPTALHGVPGEVFSIAETVISPGAVVEKLAARNEGCCLKISGEASPTQIVKDESGVSFMVACKEGELTFDCNVVLLCAGAGNEKLRQAFGLPPGRMQIRPLRMVMVRKHGLPMLNGHCIDGARTRVTITTNMDSKRRTVWQVGGQIAEDAVNLSADEIRRRALTELRDTMPSFEPEGAEIATYQADRAEERTDKGFRPDDVSIILDGHVATVWPTKLALAPRAAELVLYMLGKVAKLPAPPATDWPAPPVGLPPWETATDWRPFE